MPPLLTTLIVDLVIRLSGLGLEFTKLLVSFLVWDSHFSNNQEVLSGLSYGMEMATPWPIRKWEIPRYVAHLITIIALYWPRPYTS